MSQQSILEITQHRYAAENQKALLGMSDDYFHNKHFLIGPGVDTDRRNHAMLFHEFLCDKGCSIVNYIEDKIAGRLEDSGCPPKKKRLKYLLDQCQEDLGCCHQETLEVAWSGVEW